MPVALPDRPPGSHKLAEFEARPAPALKRNVVLTALMALCLANGFLAKALVSIERHGVAAAVLDTFDVSAVVWIAAVVGITLVSSDRGLGAWRPVDGPIAAIIALLVLAPAGLLSWAALSIVAVWTILTTDRGGAARRGAWITLAMTMPMCWTRLLFSFFAEETLSVDAWLTALLLRTGSSGNLVRFVDGAGYFQIYPACSSFGNMSLAILAWVLTLNLFGRQPPRREFAWGAAACLAVVCVNVLRLVAIGLFPEHFELIHGDVGNAVVGWITLAAVGLVCVAGVRSTVSATHV